MQWLNILTSDLRAPEFVGCEPVARATWLCVLAYCVEQENSGRIVGAKAWGDRRWQQTCGVMLSEVNTADPLLRWEGEDLVIWAFPQEQQDLIQQQREAGRIGGLKSGAARKKAKQEGPGKAQVEPPSQPLHQATNEGHLGGGVQGLLEVSLERKGREGKERKDNPPLSPLSGESLSDPLRLRAQKLHRKRPETPWDRSEEAAWKSARPVVEATTEEEWQLLEWFYALPQPVSFARKNLATTLNNWSGEIQRARAMKVKPATPAAPARPILRL